MLLPSSTPSPMPPAYFFAGVKRKASVAEELKKLCAKDGLGLVIFEVDVLIGGSEHDLLDKDKQEMWIQRIENGDFDVVMLSPPCGTWNARAGKSSCAGWPW